MVEPALWIFSATYLYSPHINNLPLVIFTYLEIVVDVLSFYKTPNKQVPPPSGRFSLADLTLERAFLVGKIGSRSTFSEL